MRSERRETSKEDLTSSQWLWVLGIVVFILIAIYFGATGGLKGHSKSFPKVENSGLDASVYQVEQYLKKSYLKDPDSYESIEWSKVQDATSEGYRYGVRHKFRAKNSFGGYAVENKIFYLDGKGSVVAAIDIE